jgi:tetratricopeptide (TPR) repeat protein
MYQNCYICLDKERLHEKNLLMQETLIDTDIAMVRSIQGTLYSYLHAYQNAIDEFTEAIALYQQRENSKHRLIDMYRQRAEAYRKLEDYIQMVADYSAALALDPQRSQFYCSRGNAYKMLRLYDRALEDYSYAIALDNRQAEPYYCRAVLYSMVFKDREKAIADYSAALSCEPTFVQAHVKRGHNYLELQRYEQALDDFSRVIQLQPRMAIAYYERGLVYQQLGHAEKSAVDYHTALQLDPELARLEQYV